jgi:hypothetical protein
MFGLNWLRRRVASSQSTQRQIFRYWDGQRLRSIDPIVATRGLLAVEGFDWRLDPKRIDRGDEEALERTVAATREIFGVTGWIDDSSGGGLTEQETLSLLISFALYLTALKKSGSRYPILPPPTELEPLESSVTSAESDSGSTSPDSTTEQPSPSA